MLEDNINGVCHITTWETYKVLNKLQETIHHRRKLAKEKAAEESIDYNQTSIELCLNTSNIQLVDLLSDGKELITNIKLANERRESQRRIDEAKQRQRLLNDLQNESVEATSKLTKINTLWADLDDGKDPKQLFDGLNYQCTRIQELMHQKLDIINELQDALRLANERYNLDQIKQEADIQCLIERIDEQIEVMKIAYCAHLELLHESIDGERIAFKQFHSNKWQDLHDDRSVCEQERLNNAKLTTSEYDQEIDKIRLQHEELNRETRIKLEQENDLLQRKLQSVKAETMLKTEQLDYNHYVLHKRAEENVTVRNKQKYRLNKLRTYTATIRRNILQTKQLRIAETEGLTQEVQHLYTNIIELERRLIVLAESNDGKFHHVWEMHEEDANEKTKNILSIDRILHEEHLQLEWFNPIGNLIQKNKLKSIQNAQNVLSEQRFEDSKLLDATKADMRYDNLISRIFLSITEEIVNHGQWLLDDKLDELLASIDDNNKRNLISIDGVCLALGIDSMGNLCKLKEYLMPYTQCTKCDKKYNTEDQQTSAKVESIENKIAYDQSHIICPDNEHNFAIEHCSILLLLQKFINEMNANKMLGTSKKLGDKSSIETNTISRIVDAKDIDIFWKSYENISSSEMEVLWSVIETGLNKYLQVLKKRQKLNADCESLRLQNTELNHLLQQYSIS